MRLEDVRKPRRLRQHELGAHRVAGGAVVDDEALVVEEEKASGAQTRGAGVEAFPEDFRLSGTAGAGAGLRHHAFLRAHRGRGGRDLPVELVLDVLVLEVADENPRQRTGKEEADGDDAGGRGEEAEAEAQLPASSSR